MLKVNTLLKIKDDIDLEKLEDFKFTTAYYKEYYKFMSEDEYLWVDKHSRKIDMTSPNDFCKFNRCRYVLNKLTKADMVEKVVEDEQY